jgi:hypothetical protein
MEHEQENNAGVPVADETKNESPVTTTEEETKQEQLSNEVSVSAKKDETADEWEDEDDDSSFKRHTANAALGK